METTCTFCGKIFSVKPHRLKKQKTCCCSRKCKGSLHSITNTGKNNGNYKGGLVKVKCPICGKAIERNLYQIKKNTRSYCSRKCMHIGHSLFYSGKNNPKYKFGKKAASYKTFVKKIGYAEKTKRSEDGSLSVTCTYCGKYFTPTYNQVQDRVKALNGSVPDERRFYCSDGCRDGCPIYFQKKFPRGFKNATSREVIPLLRQLVFKRDKYECQKCGSTKKLHCHHIQSYKLNIILSNDPDNCITLCKKCHKQVHAQRDCTYQDLKCA